MDEIKHLVFNTNLSINDIAEELSLSSDSVFEIIEKNGWDWVRKTGAKLSRGHSRLMYILTELMPRVDIVTEHPIGQNLFLDIFVPVYNLGIEYHGRQHFEFVQHYHGDLNGFEKSKERDAEKQRICNLKSIALVTFTYQDELTVDVVYNRVIDILNQPIDYEEGDGEPAEQVLTWREFMAQKRRERNRQAYRRAKELKDARDRNDRSE